MEPKVVRVDSLHIYPVKSCHGIDLVEATICSNGLEWDRNWVIAGQDGVMITQRDKGAEKLAQVLPRVSADGLELVIRGHGIHTVPLVEPTTKLEPTTIHEKPALGRAESAEVSKFFSDYLGRQVRLMRMDHAAGRVNDPFFAGHDRARSAGQDGFQHLVVSQESLDDLNARRTEIGKKPVPMSRFRPNVVISGLGAWGEDDFELLVADSDRYDLRLVKPCGRCKIPAVDQESGIYLPKEGPLADLQTLCGRRLKNAKGAVEVMFGQNALSERGFGVVARVGDLLVATPRVSGRNVFPVAV